MKLEENNTKKWKTEQHGFLLVHVKNVARKLKVSQTLHGVSRVLHNTQELYMTSRLMYGTNISRSDVITVQYYTIIDY